MKRETGLLAKIDKARVESWIASMGGRAQDTIGEILDPGLKQVTRLTDDELAEVIAREPNSKLGHLAARVARQRESWRIFRSFDSIQNITQAFELAARPPPRRPASS
jgi:hypothetical protein